MYEVSRESHYTLSNYLHGFMFNCTQWKSLSLSLLNSFGKESDRKREREGKRMKEGRKIYKCCQGNELLQWERMSEKKKVKK